MTVFRMFSPIIFLLVCLKLAGWPLYWERAVHLVLYMCWVGLFEVSWVVTLLGKSCLSGSQFHTIDNKT